MCGTVLCDIATHAVVANAAQSTDAKSGDYPNDYQSSQHLEAMRELKSTQTRLLHERLLSYQDDVKTVVSAAAAGDDAESPRMKTSREETKHTHSASKFPHAGAQEDAEVSERHNPHSESAPNLFTSMHLEGTPGTSTEMSNHI